MSGEELTDVKRVALIRQAFRACGAEPTEADVARQFRYETGRDAPRRRMRDDGEGIEVYAEDGHLVTEEENAERLAGKR